MDLKSLIAKYNIKQSGDQSESKIQPWLKYAIKVIQDFDIKNSCLLVTDKHGKVRKYTKNYQAIIFRHAHNNMSYLQGKVELCKEKFGENGLKGKGNYLFSLFRKKRPWEN